MTGIIMNNKSAEILVAEDDKSVRLVVQQALARQGYTVQSSGTAAGLWKLVESGKGDVLITDVALPDGDALDLLPRIQQRRPDLPVIVMSARSTLLTAVKTQQIGVFEYLPKPFELRSLIEVTQRAVAAVGSSSSACAAGPPPLGATTLDGATLVGRSPAMQEIFKAMARIVSNDLTVLISGESGTGKELVARALHDLGHRKAGQFVAVNLAAVPRDMVEIELFGQVGPRDEIVHQGCFAKADGGTLFLDEVGDMPAVVQTRLLRVLQDNRFLPVGAKRPVEVNLRVMASTNQNLYHLMHQGLFREDLFYRLNVINIKSPALRERSDDIPALANHFLKKYNKKLSKNIEGISQEAMDVLKKYNYPGNVRELENIIERTVALEAGSSILPESLPPFVNTSKILPSRFFPTPPISLIKILPSRVVNADSGCTIPSIDITFAEAEKQRTFANSPNKIKLDFGFILAKEYRGLKEFKTRKPKENCCII